MLCQLPHYHHHHHHQSTASATAYHGRLRRNPNPNSPTLRLPLFPSRQPLTTSLHAHDPLALDESDISRLSRRQNAPPTPLLLRRSHSEDDEKLLLQKKAVEEASLATRRTPRFPGSVDFPGTERLKPSPPSDPRRALGGDDLHALHRALELRRGVAAEILKAALRARKLSINYANNLVSCLPEFIDRVVIGAAALKGSPELAHLSFNARAKQYINDSGVVALVKWLKHNQLSFHQIGKVICLCSGDLEEVRRVCEWMKTVHVKGEFLGRVLVKAGPIWERSSEAMEEIICYLEKKGVRRVWAGYVIGRCPQVLALSMEELETRVKFFMDMGMSDRDFGTMVFDYPRVLGFYSLDEMNILFQFQIICGQRIITKTSQTITVGPYI